MLVQISQNFIPWDLIDNNSPVSGKGYYWQTLIGDKAFDKMMA